MPGLIIKPDCRDDMAVVGKLAKLCHDSDNKVPPSKKPLIPAANIIKLYNYVVAGKEALEEGLKQIAHNLNLTEAEAVLNTSFVWPRWNDWTERDGRPILKSNWGTLLHLAVRYDRPVCLPPCLPPPLTHSNTNQCSNPEIITPSSPPPSSPSPPRPQPSSTPATTPARRLSSLPSSIAPAGGSSRTS